LKEFFKQKINERNINKRLMREIRWSKYLSEYFV